MKLSVSLPEEDVRSIDEFAAAHGLASRSAVLHRAVRALRHESLVDAYAAAFDEWAESDDAQLWDGVADDGLHHAEG